MNFFADRQERQECNKIVSFYSLNKIVYVNMVYVESISFHSDLHITHIAHIVYFMLALMDS